MDAARRRARIRVTLKRVYLSLLGIFAIIAAGLVAINALASPGTWWFYWPVLGLAIVAGILAVVFFGMTGVFTRGWEDRQIERLIEKDGHVPRTEIPTPGPPAR